MDVSDIHAGSLEVMRALMSGNILLMEGGTQLKTQRQRGVPAVKSCNIQEDILDQ